MDSVCDAARNQQKQEEMILTRADSYFTDRIVSPLSRAACFIRLILMESHVADQDELKLTGRNTGPVQSSSPDLLLQNLSET